MEGGPASRLMRWILKLQEYHFTVEHKPGVLHKDADGVSSLVCAVVDPSASYDHCVIHNNLNARRGPRPESEHPHHKTHRKSACASD
eukprot:1028223-Prymnesium_polylepis.1